jgi:hypothetical protein
MDDSDFVHKEADAIAHHFDKFREPEAIKQVREILPYSVDDITAALRKRETFALAVRDLFNPHGLDAKVMNKFCRHFYVARKNRIPSTITSLALTMEMDRATLRRLLSRIEKCGMGRVIGTKPKMFFQPSKKFNKLILDFLALYMKFYG